MHSLLSLSLLAFSASASFICNDPQREVHVCCESPSPKKIYNGATLAHGQKCVAAMAKKDSATQQMSYRCRKQMTALLSLNPELASTKQELIPACCNKEVPHLLVNYSHDCLAVSAPAPNKSDSSDSDDDD
ncbi:hypothetical protein EG328_002115 [Venturia inaequalis]|uniref:Bifunctional inhibitor/plant lipid transfer protein/seed storage helical domain-containing protein n=1 Tax=Venturia inaequalis TaxID=5025 RepID=A0A8H3UXN5_VENIN|nr:hypothetical protein EG328_002115 [Venturia inaequalis]